MQSRPQHAHSVGLWAKIPRYLVSLKTKVMRGDNTIATEYMGGKLNTSCSQQLSSKNAQAILDPLHYDVACFC
ncbi:hypothetical protein CVT25_001643 [Psilocybe cyanescens]|uniref:Uncharacterized protein n=1 Tax=Psilocybe cyanescens TaxID=93625 RepID=A0A409X5N5_PSICY|nr:hypothetical protein CVT25_001643 [Psilocybe cyanescens]